MPSIDLGTLSGSGLINFGTFASLSDFDYSVDVIGPKVMVDDNGTRKRLKFAGWWAFSNSTYAFGGAPNGEVVETGFFEWDHQDVLLDNRGGSINYDQFEYKISPGTEIHVQVTF